MGIQIFVIFNMMKQSFPLLRKNYLQIFLIFKAIKQIFDTLKKSKIHSFEKIKHRFISIQILIFKFCPMSLVSFSQGCTIF